MLLKEFNNYLHKNAIQNYIIVGSYAIKDYLNREVNDLDFSIYNKNNQKEFIDKYITKKGFSFHEYLDGNIDFYKNRYYAMGLADVDLVTKKLIQGIQLNKQEIYVVLPEVEIAYKILKNRQKDILDLQYIKKNHEKTIDWALVNKLLSRSRKIYCLRPKLLRLEKLIKKIFKRIGL